MNLADVPDDILDLAIKIKQEEEEETNKIREYSKKDKRRIGDFVAVAVEHYANNKGFDNDRS